MAESTKPSSTDKPTTQPSAQRSSSTLTTDTAALGTATDDGKGTPEPGRTLRGTPFGVSGDVLNPAFAAPRDEGHEKNLKAGEDYRAKQQEGKE